MSQKTLLISISIDEASALRDLKLRHLLVETLEGRRIGDVIEETSSFNTMEVVLQVDYNKKTEDEIHNILISLGLNDYYVQDISVDDE